MLRHQGIDRLCCIVLAATLALTCCFMGAAASGLIGADTWMGYEDRLFDQSYVHTIDIVMNDWDGFIETCTNEEYADCVVVIDGESCGSVGIRAKGNTSLSSVSSYGNDRYSFKIEFDQYETGKSYYGLDKLSLNNLIQDKTYMKDYIAYTLMGRMGASAPLCSFVQVNVNGQPWGVYLAVEAVEDGFLTRNYGVDHGDLYKPDSLSMGGGRGNGRDFDMSQFSDMFSSDKESGEAAEAEGSASSGASRSGSSEKSGSRSGKSGMSFGGGMNFPGGGMSGAKGEEGASGGFDFSQMMGGFGGFGGMGSSDVMLQYVDDDPDSYPNIFGSAKTNVTEADQERLIEALRKLSEGETLSEKLEAVDAEAVIRYLVVHNFMDNGDSYTGTMIHNYYLYEEDGKLSLLPWDYNLAFGGFSMGGGFSFGGASGATSSVNSPIDSPVSSGDVSSRPIISWIFEDEEYTQLYHEIYQEFVDAFFTNGWLTDEIQRVADMLAPYVEADENGFATYEEFMKATETLKEYCALRGQSIAGQLDGSIPSTTAAQSANSGTLIDASHIELSDLGEFGMGGGRGGFEMPGMGGGSFEMPEGFSFPGGGSFEMPEGFSFPGGGSFEMPEGFSIPGAEGSDAVQPGRDEKVTATITPESTAMPGGGSFPGMPGGGSFPNMPSGGNGDMTMPDGFTMPGGGSFPGASGGNGGFTLPGGKSAMTVPDSGVSQVSMTTSGLSVSQLSMTMPSGGGFPGMPEGFSGQMPEGFSGQMPEGFSGQMPEGFNPFGQSGQAAATAAPDEQTGEGKTEEAVGDETAQETAPEATDASNEEDLAAAEKGDETGAESLREKGSSRMPGGFSGSMPGTVSAANSAEQWMLLAVCAAVLLAAVIFVKCFRSGR